MYSYLLKIKLAYPSQTIDFNKFSGTIKNAINESNKSSKSIQICLKDIKEDFFLLEVTSSYEIQHPGKSIRLFSQEIVKSHYFDSYVRHGKLFSTFPVGTDEETQEVFDPDTISDAELVKCLVDYMANKSQKDYIKRRKALNEMKKIAHESGLL